MSIKDGCRLCSFHSLRRARRGAPRRQPLNVRRKRLKGIDTPDHSPAGGTTKEAFPMPGIGESRSSITVSSEGNPTCHRRV
jgi:hypothetical protein